MSDYLLLDAARREQGSGLPVWFMRQAGRSLPEYRKLREGVGMLESCRRPELAVEITLQPVRRHGVDAAIFFSDIMVPLQAAGVDLDIKPGVGPVIADPVRSAEQILNLPELDPADITDIADSIRGVREGLPEGATLIGFAGAPFTLASYLVEGGPSKNYAHTKALMAGDPDLWHTLCAKLARISETFLQVQIEAGAQAIQLFDSWAGSLAAEDYRSAVLPHSTWVLERVAEVPRIHFGVGTGELLPLMGRAGADVVGVDWRIPLDEATGRIGPDYAVQGNLDPAILGAPWEVVAERVRSIIRAGARAPGHIFNLGHGVPPTTDPDVLTRVVELVHQEGPAIRDEVISAER